MATKNWALPFNFDELPLDVQMTLAQVGSADAVAVLAHKVAEKRIGHPPYKPGKIYNSLFTREILAGTGHLDGSGANFWWASNPGGYMRHGSGVSD